MKKLIAIVLSLVLVFSFASCAAAPVSDTEQTSSNVSVSKELAVTVVFKDGTSKEITGIKYSDGDKLGNVLETAGVISDVDNGMFNTVDGEKLDFNVDKYYWCFYINDEMAMNGVYDITINPEETYKFVATDGSSFG